MPWFGAHIVMSVKFKDGVQSTFPAWENIYLLEAVDGDRAWKKAEEVGKTLEGDSNGTFMWNERAAEWVFAGVRKVVGISNASGDTGSPGDRNEVTYSTFEFADRAALVEFANGRKASATIVE